MGERTINVNSEWYETVTAELKAKDKRIAELEARVEPLQPFKERIIELEAKLGQWRIAGEFWHKKHTALNTEYNRLWGEITTLEDGLRELAEQHHGAICSSWSEWDQGRQDGRNAVVTDIEALLGKESGDE